MIFHHTWYELYNKGFLKNNIHTFSGPFFLDTFFVISGFLISFILAKEIQSGKYNVKNFFMRRILRIWPLYFFAVIVRIIIFPVVNHVPWETIQTNLLYACTFSINYQLLFTKVMNSYIILWSVGIEEHIYLLLPLFVLLFRKNIRNISFFMIIAGIISWTYFMKVPSPSGFSTSYFVSSSYFYFFGLGVLLAAFYQKIKDGKIKLIFSVPAQIAFFILGGMYVFNKFPATSYEMPGFSLKSGLLSLYFVALATQENFILRIKPKVTRYLGNISYGMYIVHIPIVDMVTRNMAHQGEGFKLNFMIPIITLLITIALSTLLYYILEKPVLKLKSRFSTVGNK